MCPGPPGSRWRAPPARTPSGLVLERRVDHGAEVLDGERAGDDAAVDDERRRAPHADRAGLLHVGLDLGREAARVETRRELLARQAHLAGVTQEVGTLELRLVGEQLV